MRWNVGVRFGAVAVFGLLAFGSNARADVIGTNVTITSTVASNASESVTAHITGSPEVQFGDADAFSWMTTGDAINIGYSSDPVAPYEIDIDLGKTNDFSPSEGLQLTFEFDPSVQIDPSIAAIVRAITVDEVSASLTSDSVTVNIADMSDVSQGDFGGQVELIFAATGGVPAPGALSLLGLGLVLTVAAGRSVVCRRTR